MSDNLDSEVEMDAAHNVVAIFHASFHPTKGNTIDWSLKHDESIDLDGVEFCVLPSGLHLVERDTVYFSHKNYAGIAVFRRRPTQSKSHRGFRLSSLGILLQEAPRPRPWLHLHSLRELADRIYGEADGRESGGAEDLLGLGNIGTSLGDLKDEDFAPAVKWFERRRADDGLTPFGSWSSWIDELDGCYNSPNTPTHHLPHLLRILGLSSLTLYKFVLARRRILIFTLPPVEVAGVLAWLSSDLCCEYHMAPRNQTLGTLAPSLLSSTDASSKDTVERSEQSPKVLGMVTLNDLQRLERESASGRGWIACTTDALFMERPQYYDLVIDLTTSTPYKSSRPTLHLSKMVPSPSGKKRATFKLETVRFTWSDVKLWTELDRILKLDTTENIRHMHGHGACCVPGNASATSNAGGPGSSSSSSVAAIWSDAFRVYDDVCVMCATLWMGIGTWRSNSRQSFSSGGRVAWGAAKAPGDADWSMDGTHMRSLGQGIEGRARGDKDKGKDIKVRVRGMGIEGKPVAKTSHSRKASSSSTYKVPGSASTRSQNDSVSADDGADAVPESALSEEEREEIRMQNVQTTLALLQTLHANTVFWLSQLREILPPPSYVSSPRLGSRLSMGQTNDDREAEEITITSRDLLSLELGVVSELDAKFIEWLAEVEDNATRRGSSSSLSQRRIIVKRGWTELLGIVLGIR